MAEGFNFPARPDEVIALAAYLQREWPYGARLAVQGRSWGAVAECVAADGGRWFIICDRDAVHLAYGDTEDEAKKALAAARRAEVDAQSVVHGDVTPESYWASTSAVVTA